MPISKRKNICWFILTDINSDIEILIPIQGSSGVTRIFIRRGKCMNISPKSACFRHHYNTQELSSGNKDNKTKHQYEHPKVSQHSSSAAFFLQSMFDYSLCARCKGRNVWMQGTDKRISQIRGGKVIARDQSYANQT